MNTTRTRTRGRLWLAALGTVVVLAMAAGVYGQVSAFSLGDLRGALRARGATVRDAGAASTQTFRGAGHGLTVNGTHVAVYEYGTIIAAQYDAARVTPDGSTFRGGFGPLGGGGVVVDWIATPHHFMKGRVIVTYIGDDGAIVGLLTGVLGPQFAGGGVDSQ